MVSNKKNRSFESYKSMLFDDRRLQKRFLLFKKFSLPSLASQIVPYSCKIHFMILISTDLPPIFKEQLINTLDEYSNIFDYIIVSISPEEEIEHRLSEELYKQVNAKKRGGAIATVRLDDDDALSPYYSTNLCKYIDEAFSGMAISFPRGYLVEVDENTNIMRTMYYYYPKISAGLAYISHPIKQEIKLKHVHSLGDHLEVDEHTPTIIDASFQSYIQTAHPYTDTGRVNQRWIDQLPIAEEDIEMFFDQNSQYISSVPPKQHLCSKTRVINQKSQNLTVRILRKLKK
jgi:hypothetical protein